MRSISYTTLGTITVRLFDLVQLLPQLLFFDAEQPANPITVTNFSLTLLFLARIAGTTARCGLLLHRGLCLCVLGHDCELCKNG